MRTAVVILNWNGKQHLANYLPGVVQYSNIENVEVYVADNGSTDDSVQYLKSRFPQIKRIEFPENYGFAGGYNKALEQVEADIYCILNSDVLVTPNWLNPVVDLFENEADVAAIQPKILSDRDKTKFEHAGAAGGYIDKYGYPFCKGRIVDHVETDHGQYNKQSQIFWASGACLFIRSSVFHDNGGFDANYFAHMEEIDLCWRIKNQGHSIVYCPNSTVYHYGGATLDYNNPRKLFLNFRNSLWTLYKNYTGNCLRCIMIKRMLIDTIALAKFVATFDFKSASTVLKAHLAYYKSKPELKAKRAKLKAGIVKTKHPEMLNGSIVFQFFLWGKKTFVNLNPNKFYRD